MQDKDPNLPGFYKKKNVEVSEIIEDEDKEDLEGLMDDEFEDMMMRMRNLTMALGWGGD